MALCVSVVKLLRKTLATETQRSHGDPQRLIFRQTPPQAGLSNLFLSSNVKTQRHVRQMRVIILRLGAERKLALVVVDVLISKIPIEMAINLDRQPSFGRLETHGIRRNQRASQNRRERAGTNEASTSGVGYTVALPAILIDPIGRK